jgi:predicted RNA-binding Zn ribbon-like protein
VGTESAPNPSPLPKRFRLVGGALCLDLCNTMGGKREGTAREKLHSYFDFLFWCEQAGLISPSQATALKEKAAQDPTEASAVLRRVLELREATYRVFFGLFNEQKPRPADLAVVNGELAQTLGWMRVSPQASGFGWSWCPEELQLDYPLGPLAHSAASLLISHDCCAHVRQCRGDNCGWLFLDSSKNHSRCWCDMSDCGNRAKVRRHREKHRG